MLLSEKKASCRRANWDSGKCALKGLRAMGLWLVMTLACLETAAAATVISSRDEWRFNDSDNLDGVDWQSPSYDDSNWHVGNAAFHAGNPDKVAYPGTSLTPGRGAYYFRHRFFGPAPTTNVTVSLNAIIGDGAVIHLNGEEIRRVRMPARPTEITHATPAIAAPQTSNGILWPERIDLTAPEIAGLIEGENVLAVEVHPMHHLDGGPAWGSSLTVELTHSPPVFFSHPESQTVTEGRYMSLRTQVDADPNPELQWYKNGQLLEGATNHFLGISRVGFGAAGDYHQVAVNEFGSITSRVATVTITPDLTPPRPLLAYSQLDQEQILIWTDDWLSPTSAANLGNFNIVRSSRPLEDPPVVLDAVVTSASRILITTSPREAGVNYTLTVGNLQDASEAGNVMPESMTVPLLYEVELVGLEDGRTWSYFAEGRAPEGDWIAPDFNDLAWRRGHSYFHGGSPPPDHPTPPGTYLPLLARDTGDPIVTYYFRTHFERPPAFAENSLTLRDLTDDGMMLHVNGESVHSRNLPFYSDYETHAYTFVEEASIQPPHGFPAHHINGNLLPGENTLAVEVHQHHAGYNDVTFGLSLIGMVTNFPPQPVLELPATVLEGTGVLPGAGKVRFAEPLNEHGEFALVSDEPDLVGVPERILVPAGASVVDFDLNIGDDALINGQRFVTVRAYLAGDQVALGDVTVLDDEFNTMSFTVPETVGEADGLVEATLFFASPADRDVLVTISSSLSYELPTHQIVMPAGSTNTVFSLPVVNTPWLDGDRPVTFTALVEGWPPAESEALLLDDETATLTLEVQGEAVEGRVLGGVVSLGGLLATDLTISLTSDNPDALQVPPTVIVAAGGNQTTFEITLPEDLVPELSQSVRITATATGFAEAGAWVDIVDNDPGRLLFGNIPSPQTPDRAFEVFIEAQDANGNRLDHFHSHVTLAAAGLQGDLPLQNAAVGPFDAGVWHGPVQVLSPDRFIRLRGVNTDGQSPPFRVEHRPLLLSTLDTVDIAWHEGSRTLFATTPTTGDTHANQLVAIDPNTGLVTNSYPVQPGPGSIEISSDGAFMYLTVSNRTAMQRFDIGTRTAGAVFALGEQSNTPLRATDFGIVNGATDSVVVSRATAEDGWAGVWRYDSGTPVELRQLNEPGLQPRRLETAASGQALYGFRSDGEAPLLRTMAQDGATVTVTNNLFNSGRLGDVMILRDGVLYNGFGRAVRAGTFEWLGDFTGVVDGSSSMALPESDPDMDRVFFLTGAFEHEGGAYRIRAHRRSDRMFAAELSLPEIQGFPQRFLRWSTNGLVFNTSGGELWFVHSNQLQPTDPKVDLQLTRRVDPLPPVVGRELSWSLSVTNRGQDVATFITITNSFPEGFELVEPSTSGGEFIQTDTGFRWTLDKLDAGSGVQLEGLARFNRAGKIRVIASASSHEADVSIGNNSAAHTYEVGIPQVDGVIEVVNLSIEDMLYNPVTDRLWLAGANKLTEFDPHTLQIGTVLNIADGPDKLLVSADGETAYVALKKTGKIRRLRLADFGVEQEFAVGTDQVNERTHTLYADDMAEIPGEPGNLVLSRRRLASQYAHEIGKGLAVYLNGAPPGDAVESGGSWRLEFNELDGSLIAIDRKNGSLQGTSYEVNGTSLTPVEVHEPVAGRHNDELIFVDGRMVSFGGRRLHLAPYGVDGVFSESVDASLAAIAPDVGGVWFLHFIAEEGWRLNLHDLESLLLVGSIPVRDLEGEPEKMITWGTNGVAIHTSADQLIILRTDLHRTDALADVGVSADYSSAPVGLHTETTIDVTLTNSGPTTARQIETVQELGEAFVATGVDCPAGDCFITSTNVIWRVEELAAGESLTLRVTAGAQTNGLAKLEIRTTPVSADNNRLNNAFIGFLQAGDPHGHPDTKRLELDVEALVWLPQQGELLLSHTSSGPWKNVLLGLDPTTLRVRPRALLPGTAGPVVLSGDKSRLFAAAGPSIASWKLPQLDRASTFPVAAGGRSATIQHLVAMPQTADELVVALRDTQYRLRVFGNGTARPVEASGTAQGTKLIAGESNNLFEARYDGRPPVDVARYVVDETGIILTDKSEHWWLHPPPADLAWTGEYLVTDAGEAIDPHLLTLAGRFMGVTGPAPVMYDPRSGRVLFIDQHSLGSQLKSFDTITRIALAEEGLPEAHSPALGTTLWGANGIAFRTEDGSLFLHQSGLIPSGEATDLAADFTSSPAGAEVGAPAEFAITVENLAATPAPKTRLALSVSQPGALTFGDGISWEQVTPKEYLIHLGNLPGAGVHMVTLTVAPSVPGEFTLLANALSDSTETDLANNTVESTVPTSHQLSTNESIELPIPATEIVYNPETGLIYLAGGRNEIKLIRPDLALITGSWGLPFVAGPLALPTGGDRLFVGGARTGRMLQLDTIGGGVLMDFAPEETTKIFAIKPLPNEEGSFILGRSGTFWPRLSVFDGENRRALSTIAGAEEDLTLTLEAGQALVYSLGQGSGHRQLRGYRVSPEGIEQTPLSRQLPADTGGLSFLEEWLYTDGGYVIDLATARVIARFPGVDEDAVAAAQVDQRRVFFLTPGETEWELRAHDLDTLALLGSQIVPNVEGKPGRLLRWGADGFAFNTSGNQLFLLRSDLAVSGPAADLSIEVTSHPPSTGVDEPAVVALTLRNHGPAPAKNVVLPNRFSTNTALISWQAPGAIVSTNTGSATFHWPTLAVGAEIEVALTVAASQPGWSIITTTATSSNLDPARDDNFVQTRIPVSGPLVANTPVTLEQSIADAAFDPVSGLIYAALTNHQHTVATDIVAIDPRNGMIVDEFAVADDLSRLAISDDGTKLHAIGRAGSLLHRVDLPTRRLELTTSLTNQANRPPMSGSDLEAVPGDPNAVAVILSSSTGTGRLYLYRNGIEQPLGGDVANDMAFFSPTGLVTWNSVWTRRYELRTDGFVEQATSSFRLDNGRLAESGGLVYTANGQVFDPGTLSLVRDLGVSGTVVAPDANAGRVAFANDRGSDTRIKIVDTMGSTVWLDLPLQEARGSANRLLRCGANRLAYLSSEGQLFLLQTPVIGGEAPADLAVGLMIETPDPRSASTFNVTFSITNHGPAQVSAARLNQTLPPGTSIVSTTALGPTMLLSDGRLLWDVFNLPPGEIRTNRVTLLVDQPGLYPQTLRLRSTAADANPANDVLHPLWSISDGAVAEAVRIHSLPTADMIREPLSKRLLLTIPANSSGISNSVVSVDPETGELGEPFPVGPNPGKLAASNDGQFLHVVLDAPASIAKVRLADRQVVRVDELATAYEVRELHAIPGRHDMVAVVYDYKGLEILRDGNPLTTEIDYAGRRVTSIALHPTEPRIFGFAHWGFTPEFSEFSYSDDNFQRTDTREDVFENSFEQIELSGGRLVSGKGEILDLDTLAPLINLGVPGVSHRVALDPDNDVFSFLSRDGTAWSRRDTWTVRQFTWDTFAPVREFRVPHLRGDPQNFESWGDGNLAFTTTSNQLFIIRSELTVADVGIEILSSPVEVIATQTNALTFVLTNHTDRMIPDVIVSNRLQSAGGITGILSPPHLSGFDNVIDSSLLRIGDLAAHSDLVVTFGIRTENVGEDQMVNNVLTVLPPFTDHRPIDNSDQTSFFSHQDSDRDGLPDRWEELFGLNPHDDADGDLDADVDGLTNSEEFLAGTAPNDPASTLRVVPAPGPGGTAVIRFVSRPGRSYAVDWSPALPALQWRTLEEDVVATSEETTVSLTPLAQEKAIYVRIRLNPPGQFLPFSPP